MFLFFTQDIIIMDTESVQKNIHQLYRETLGRSADDDGLIAATSNIIGGYITLDQLRTSLLDSDEYKHRTCYKELSLKFKQNIIDRITHEVFADPQQRLVLPEIKNTSSNDCM